MRGLSKNVVLIAGALVSISAPACAMNFLEALFGIPEQRTEVPNAGDRNASPPNCASQPRQARAKAGSPVTIHNHIRVAISHGRDGGDAIIHDYLKSADFTRRFTSSAPDSTREALAFLLQNDATLRPGDAVVTREGVVVLNGEKRQFAPAAKMAFDRSLRERLLAFGQPKTKPQARPVIYAASDAPGDRNLPLAFSVRVTDGQLIRYVGGL